MDEGKPLIDGALGGSEGKGAIQALLNIINAGGGAAGGGGGGGGGGKRDKEDTGDGKSFDSSKKKAKGPGPLMRPIIAICNDLYAPALRPLRDVAKVFKITPPLNGRLNSRLREVCLAQKLSFDTRAVGALTAGAYTRPLSGSM